MEQLANGAERWIKTHRSRSFLSNSNRAPGLTAELHLPQHSGLFIAHICTNLIKASLSGCLGANGWKYHHCEGKWQEGSTRMQLCLWDRVRRWQLSAHPSRLTGQSGSAFTCVTAVRTWPLCSPTRLNGLGRWNQEEAQVWSVISLERRHQGHQRIEFQSG